MPNPTDTSKSAVFVSLPSSDDVTVAREQLLKNVVNNPNLPAIGSSVSRVIQLASSDGEAVRNLAYFILSDVALTQKILLLANTVCYRTVGGSQVTTISKAIFMLGFDTVKTSALAMLLVDGMTGKRGQSVRAELAHALGASVVGREMARHSPFKDAEEAAIAALFKNMGRLLVAAHDHVLYSKIAELIETGKSPSHASLEVIGCSFDTLAESVLQEWQIPDSIIQALTPLPSGVLKPAKSRSEWMQQVAAFSAAAATLLPHMKEPGEDAASKALLTRFGGALNLDQEKLTHLFNAVGDEARALMVNANLAPPMQESVAENANGGAENIGEAGAMSNAATSVVGAKADSADNADQDLPDDLLLSLVCDAASLQINERHPSGKPVNARELLMSGLQDVNEMMASGRCPVNDLIMLVLEIFHRSMGFRFSTICIKDMKANQFRARIALGEKNAERQAGFSFSAVTAKDLFHLSLENNADLLISDAADTKIQNLIPAWHRALLPDARSFVVLPLVVQGKPFGLFYADRTQPALEGVPQDETALIKTLKGQVLAALNSR